MADVCSVVPLGMLCPGVGKCHLSESEERMALACYESCDASWSPHRRQHHVASQMCTEDRHVSWQQVRNAVKRNKDTNDQSPVSSRHKNAQAKQIARRPRKRYRRGTIPDAHLNMLVDLVLNTCTLTAPQLRAEIGARTGAWWSPSAIAKARRSAGFKRKRTQTTKREACPLKQYLHAEQLINFGYCAEHFIFIGECQ